MEQMSEPIAYLNGRFLPAVEAMIPLSDAGFVLGATVSEQLRTFAGRLFRLPEHLARMRRGLEITGLADCVDLSRVAQVAEELVAHNHRLLPAGDDLGLAILVTPGAYRTLASGDAAAATVCLHTYPLPFHLWAAGYSAGTALVTTAVEQVSPRCWPAELKCRSRMHYYLADRAAAAIDPGAKALLLDQLGHVTETATANIVVYRRGEGLITPPRSIVLAGISLAVVEELAAELTIPFREESLTLAQTAAADELLLTSTPFCVLPVIRLNGKAIGPGVPGKVFGQLLSCWSRRVGVEIGEQAGTRLNVQR
jgi:branched-subunit amino acid aminotransferase/4-amino-4-deoxychorismate lyase